jgi:hypothetical protein
MTDCMLKALVILSMRMIQEKNLNLWILHFVQNDKNQSSQDLVFS